MSIMHASSPIAAVFRIHVARCFFDCGHVIRGTDPAVVDEQLETHYEGTHGRLIDAIVGAV